jgi:DNA-binding response OmpR family regulator
MRYYISIEKNVEGFEMFKALWGARGIDGIRADGMTEGIAKAIEIEKSKMDELYFIDIVADDIDYMTQLKILSAETNAPILIATSIYDDDEHHEALNNGADFYGGYCDTPEQNINAVISLVNSIDRRARKAKPPFKTIISRGIMLAPSYRNTVFVDNRKVDLTRKEFDILYYLMLNHGKVRTHKQIYRRVWGCGHEDAERDVLRNAIKRLREKLRTEPDCTDYIKTVLDVGYSFPIETDK